MIGRVNDAFFQRVVLPAAGAPGRRVAVGARIPAAAIGRAAPGEEGCLLSTPGGEKPFTIPPENRFWGVFFAAGENN